MRGFYRVFENGVLVTESDNLITTAGKKLIADYLAGNASSWAGALAIGIGTTTAVVSDVRLDFEFYRSPVTGKAVSYGTGTGGAHVITVKSMIDNTISGTIYEIGVFSDEFDEKAGAGGGVVISIGDSSEPWYVNSSGWVENPNTPDTTNQRIGNDAVLLGTGNYRLTGIDLDLSAYSSSDLFKFAMMKISGTVSTLAIRFNTDDSNYYSYSPTVATAMSGTTYTTSSFAKSNWTATGSPSWSSITSIEFITTGTNTYIMDGLRISDTDTNNPSYALISRSVLTTPVPKVESSQMEVEYYVEY